MKILVLYTSPPRELGPERSLEEFNLTRAAQGDARACSTARFAAVLGKATRYSTSCTHGGRRWSRSLRGSPRQARPGASRGGTCWSGRVFASPVPAARRWRSAAARAPRRGRAPGGTVSITARVVSLHRRTGRSGAARRASTRRTRFSPMPPRSRRRRPGWPAGHGRGFLPWNGVCCHVVGWVLPRECRHRRSGLRRWAPAVHLRGGGAGTSTAPIMTTRWIEYQTEIDPRYVETYGADRQRPGSPWVRVAT